MRRSVALGLGIALGMIGASAAAAEAVDPEAICGEYYYFFVRAPLGWTESLEPRAVVFRPARSWWRSSGTQIVVTVEDRRDDGRDADPRDVLATKVAFASVLSADVAAVRPFDIAHPELPSAGAWLETRKGHGYVVAIAIPRGGGSHASMTLATEGRAADSAELDALREALAGFRYDPDSYCRPNRDNVVEKRRLVRRPDSEPLVRGAEAEHEADRARGFALRRAMEGCALLSRMFVPINCRDARIEARDVVVVEFDEDGGKSIGEYIERHASAVALPWCFETRSASGAAPLVFRLSGEDQFQEYSCSDFRLGKRFRGTLLEAPASSR